MADDVEMLEVTEAPIAEQADDINADVRAAMAASEAPLHRARGAMADADMIISVVHWGLTGLAVAAIIALSPARAPVVALAALAATAAMEIVGALARLDVQRWKSRGARARRPSPTPAHCQRWPCLWWGRRAPRRSR